MPAPKTNCNRNRFILTESYTDTVGQAKWIVNCLWCDKRHLVTAEELRSLRCCEQAKDDSDLWERKREVARRRATMQKTPPMHDMLERPLMLWIVDGMVCATYGPRPNGAEYKMKLDYVNFPGVWSKAPKGSEPVAFVSDHSSNPEVRFRVNKKDSILNKAANASMKKLAEDLDSKLEVTTPGL